jgi:hypothetical protein
MWIELLKSIVPDSVLILAVAWLAKAITTNRLAKDVEDFKKDLTIEANRDNTVFSKLHERRALVIAEVYQALVSAESAVGQEISQTVSPPTVENPWAATTLTEMKKLIQAVEMHRIWFTPDTAAKLEDTVFALRKTWIINATGQRSTTGMVEDAHELFSKQVAELRAAVESEFRALLAVELRPK